MSPFGQGPLRPFDVIAAITQSIELLASKNQLENLETKLKSEYKEIFQPIPHVDHLPMTETARIQLKDAYKVISTRQYCIPQQFRESFAILIQKCLYSGLFYRQCGGTYRVLHGRNVSRVVGWRYSITEVGW